MNCPKCGHRVKVKNSRTVDSGRHGLNQTLVDFAEKSVGWYTQDWVVRQRKCDACEWKRNTIEIIDCDLDKMVELVAKGVHKP